MGKCRKCRYDSCLCRKCVKASKCDSVKDCAILEMSTAACPEFLDLFDYLGQEEEKDAGN